jgi:hypothetical protein
MSGPHLWFGDTARVTVQFTAPDGSPLAATGVAIVYRINRGDLVTVPAQDITSPADGVFIVQVPSDPPGRYDLRATCSGPTAAAVETSWTVEPSGVL